MRSFQFAPYFSEKFDVSYLSLFSEAYINQKYLGHSTLWESLKSYLRRFTDILKLRSADVVWMEKEAFPFLPSFFENAVRLVSKKLIVDYDDAIFHNYDDHRLSIVKMILGNKIDQVMASADLVVAGNDYIAQRALSAGATKVQIVPTVIPSSRYPEIKTHPTNSPPVIGWIGTPMTQKFLVEIEAVFDELIKTHPFTLHLIGITEDFWKNKSYRKRIAWTEESESSELAKIDIGIMPLTNNKFEQGKCGFKLIQYMGCSKPILASPVGVNTMIVNPGVNGFLCTTQSDWSNSFKYLLENPEMRLKMGQAGRMDYIEKFTQEAWGPKLVGFAEKLLEE